MWSMFVVWPSGKMIRIHRINENHYKYSDLHLCHLALDHWIGKTLLFLCDPQGFSIILSDLQTPLKLFWGDSWWFMNSEISGAILSDSQTILNSDSWWLSVICEQFKIFVGQFSVIYGPLWNCFGQFSVICKPRNFFSLILGDLQTSLKILGWFLVICQSLWIFLGWFLVICEPLWYCFGAILSDSWRTLKFLKAILSHLQTAVKKKFRVIISNSHWFLLIHEPLCNCLGVILSDYQWFVNHFKICAAIIGDSQTTLKLFWGNYQWFANHSEFFWGNSQWFANHRIFLGMILGDLQTSLKFLGWFSVICQWLSLFWDDSWWFVNHSEIVLEWFSVNHEKLWNI